MAVLYIKTTCAQSAQPGQINLPWRLGVVSTGHRVAVFVSSIFLMGIKLSLLINTLRAIAKPENVASPNNNIQVFPYETLVFDPENPKCIPPRRWRKQKPTVLALHLNCAQLFPICDLGIVSRATHYDFQPSPSSMRRRLKFLYESRVKALGENEHITTESLQEQARLDVGRLLCSPTNPEQFIDNTTGISCFTVDASKPIFSVRLVFQGVQYIQYLTNTRVKNSVLVSEQKKGSFDKVYVARDHIGVRAIFFNATNWTEKEEPGIWWSAYKASNQQRCLKGYTDGIKLRCIRLVEMVIESPGETINWTLLPPKPEAVWFFDLDDRAHSRSPFKVFYCDKPGITGYSACMIDGDLVDLHSHVRGEDFSVYRALPVDGDRLHAVWLYLPVEEDERVVEVWRRIRRPHFCRDVPLLRTNKGRVLTLGTHHNIYEQEITYERLTSFPKSGPRRFWYSCPQDGIDCFAFDTPDLRCSRQEPRVLDDPNIFVHSGVGQQAFFTTAKLENVVEVTPCKAWGPGTTGIVGLVFLYSDGHRDSVGQVRLDHLMSPIEVDQSHEQHDMWLAARDYYFNGSSGNYTTVVEMMRVMPSFVGNVNGGNPSEEGLRWMRVRWRGRLDWMFWYRSCRVNFHEEATSEGDISMALKATGGRVWEEESTFQAMPGYQPLIECA